MSSSPDHTALRFLTGNAVSSVSQAKYLGSMILWNEPFESAFHHRLGVAEIAFNHALSCSMARSRKVKLFLATFLPCLTYGLDALTRTDKHIRKIDGQSYRLLRRAIGLKASYYSRVSNLDAWTQAFKPQRPSESLRIAQYKMLHEVCAQPEKSPLYNVVFCAGNNDGILAQGRRHGMQFPYWIEVILKRCHPELSDHTDHTHISSTLR